MSKTHKIAYALSPAKSYRHVVEGIASDIRQINRRLPISITTEDYRGIDPMVEPHTLEHLSKIYEREDYTVRIAIANTFATAPTDGSCDCFAYLAKTAYDICALHRCTCVSEMLGMIFCQEEAKPLANNVAYAWDVEKYEHARQDLYTALGNQNSSLLIDGSEFSTAGALRRVLDSWEAIGDTQLIHSTIAQLLNRTYQWRETPLDRIAFAVASIACWEEYRNCHEYADRLPY